MEWFKSQLNVTTVISIASLLISLFTLGQNLLEKRKKLNLRVLSMDAYKDVMFLTLSIENGSQLPIAITNIKYITNLNEYSCTPIPTKIAEITTRRGDTILEHQVTYSERMPIQLPELGAFSGVIFFEHLPTLPENPPTALTFEVCTNRGKTFQKKVELSEAVLSHRTIY